MATVAYEKPVLDLSMPAAADYSAKQYYLMKQSSTGTATLATTAGEKCIGVLQDDPDTANDVASVRVMGVSKVVLGGTVAYDDRLTTDANGKAVKSLTGNSDYIVGTALSSGASGAIIPMLMPAGMERAGNTGTIYLPLASFQEADGTVLAAFSAGANPQAGYTATAEIFGLRWNNHANPDAVATGFTTPVDWDNSQDVTVNILAAKTGATLADAVTWTVQAFNNVDGALYDADADYCGTSSAMTGDATAKTCQLETLTLDAADLPAAGSQINITIQPTDGTLGTDDVILLGMWINYARK